MSKQLRLVGYIRVSKMGSRDEDDPTTHTIRDQQRLIEYEVGKPSRPAKLIQVFKDLDESGGKMNRPGLEAALAMIYAGQADGIVVSKLDRFARDAAAIGVIEGLERSGKVFISATENFDTTTSTGSFALGMMVLVAKLERDRHVEQWAARVADTIRKGVHTRIAYGYRRSNGRGSVLEPAEPDASIVRRIFAERRLGHGVARIADGLNADGIPAPKNPQWTRQTVRAIIRTRTYLGEASYGDHLLEGAHAPLVSQEDWTLSQPSKRAPIARGRNPLTQLVRCAGCGYAMGAGSGPEGRRYNCNRHHATGRCPSPTSAKADTVEALVVREFFARYKPGAANASSGDPGVAEKTEQRQRVEREFVRWRDDTEMRDVLGEEDYRSGLAARKVARDEAIEEETAAIRSAGGLATIPTVTDFELMSVTEKRKLLRAGIEAVVLRRAASPRQPIAERVEIRWAGESYDPLPHVPRRGHPKVQRRP